MPQPAPTYPNAAPDQFPPFPPIPANSRRREFRLRRESTGNRADDPIGSPREPGGLGRPAPPGGGRSEKPEHSLRSVGRVYFSRGPQKVFDPSGRPAPAPGARPHRRAYSALAGGAVGRGSRQGPAPHSGPNRRPVGRLPAPGRLRLHLRGRRRPVGARPIAHLLRRRDTAGNSRADPCICFRGRHPDRVAR